MTPVVGDAVCDWASEGSAMEVAPVSMRVTAKTTFKTTLRTVFIDIVSPIAAVAAAARLICNSDVKLLSASYYSR
ncbi:hypothetical protein WN73_09300 [Bradyrhizobium sp. CCBAU 45394]|uniref:Uncharacterized protein n=1 Tax=Bradyrhizobium diazoefficiens SEMIA 5080 TaxID=754504 RepID=A0A837C3N0_9BRAD|nr:hypothetical protein BJA5080_05765 [Bradyrhizobium diazoefficiens SEMIA 5080]KOY06748.1 hypothetical protein AF336_31000 [Bradyrhizobium diazoefficiens]MDA9390871.1 hypothetical protein [Bradyrhizobium sp. CCBAU 45394]MDA9538930.1 hypothetical protein [Bradyrhizobium sp. CCBAU 21362]